MKIINSTIYSNAVFSDDNKHRYLLSRIWADALTKVTIIMLNPSYADELKWDWSSMRLMNYILNHEKYGGMDIINLFSYIETNSDNLPKYSQRFDDNTDKYIEKVLMENEDIIIAWGVNKNRLKRIRKIKNIINKYDNKNIIRAMELDGTIKHISKLSNDFTLKNITVNDL